MNLEEGRNSDINMSIAQMLTSSTHKSLPIDRGLFADTVDVIDNNVILTDLIARDCRLPQ